MSDAWRPLNLVYVMVFYHEHFQIDYTYFGNLREVCSQLTNPVNPADTISQKQFLHNLQQRIMISGKIRFA